MARHSFQPRTSIFPRSVLYFPILRALLREISPFIIATLLFSHSENTFPIRVFPFFVLYPTFIFPLISFPPFIPPPSSLLPHFLSHSSPLFHLPPQLTNERAHPRATRAHAYTRTYPPVRRFSFIAFTASPTLRNPLYINTLGVKKNKKKPSHNTQQSQNQHLTTNIRFHPP